MSRILLLLVLIVWMARGGGTLPLPATFSSAGASTALFLGGFALIVLLMGLWSRVLARHVRGDNLHISLRRFNRAMYVARLLVPAWFSVGLFALRRGNVVTELLGPLERWPVELPGAILGTMPALLAWVGLWWAQFPADRALREQSVLVHLDENLPVHAPPRFLSYISSYLRLQLLFTLVPVALILLVRDVACTVLWKGGFVEPLAASGPQVDLPANVEVGVLLAAMALVFVFAPEVLRRVLKTQPLPPSALRNRLEAMCRRSGLKYREILLWHTENNMGNAAVMGVVPQVRYILLSDLLLETMTDQQIEAVFAHEVGHVVHRHMTWYAVFLAIILGGLLGPGQWVQSYFEHTMTQGTLAVVLNLGTVLAGCGGFFLVFGCLSRWFERQADVYAARTMQRYEDLNQSASLLAANAAGNVAAPIAHYDPISYVGPYGAALFTSALQRVAVINNIPLDTPPGRARVAALIDGIVEQANNWFHGSIPTRMEYLRAERRSGPHEQVRPHDGRRLCNAHVRAGRVRRVHRGDGAGVRPSVAPIQRQPISEPRRWPRRASIAPPTHRSPPRPVPQAAVVPRMRRHPR